MKTDIQYTNINILDVIFKWKFHLLGIIITTIILSSIFSSPTFIKPKFKSFAIIYPSNLIPYSTETETEQMLQIFKSDEIRDSIIAMFDIINYYDINTNKKHFYTTLVKEFEDHVNIRKTEFESVMIEVYDRDPIVACEIVKAYINLFNKKVRNMHKEKSLEVLIITRNQLTLKSNQIDSVSKALTHLSSEYNIIDFEAQAKEVTRGYLKTIDGSGAGQVNNQAVKELKTTLETKGNEYLLLNSMLKGLVEQYIELKTDYEVALRDVEKDLTYTNVVSNPIPADKKSKPVRWLIVCFSVFATLFISIAVLLFIEKIKYD